MGILDESAPIRKLDDLTIIQRFVKGDVSLLSNQNLRVETTFDSVQMLAKKEGLVASARVVDGTRQILVRQTSQYWELLNQVLLDQAYVPITFADGQGFLTYEARDVPAGYIVNYTEARAFWKHWWLNRNQYLNRSLQMDLLVFTRNKWYPVRDVGSNQGTLFITTLVGDLILQGSEPLVWLHKPNAQTLPRNLTPSPTALTPPNPSDPEQTLVYAPGQSNTPSPPASPNRFSPPTNPNSGSPGQGRSSTHDRSSLPPQSLQKRAPNLDLNPPPGQLTPSQQAGTLPTASPTPTNADQASSLVPAQPASDQAAKPAQTQGLDSVLRFYQGRLHLKTLIGEVIVEGNNLTFSLIQPDGIKIEGKVGESPDEDVWRRGT